MQKLGFRHCEAIRMVASGAREEDIRRIMCHADYSMTANVYGNTAQWELRASADLLPHYAVLPYIIQSVFSLKDAVSKMA